MTVPFLCLAAMLFLIVLTKTPVMVAQMKMPGGLDNNNPRDQYAKLTGWGRRAHAAHNNTFEAVTIFTPAVLISHFAPAETAGTAATLAVTFLIARVIYPVVYIIDIHWLRSLVWMVGLIAALWMSLLPWLAA